jgi:uncharacterized protein (DUF58 family)
MAIYVVAALATVCGALAFTAIGSDEVAWAAAVGIAALMAVGGADLALTIKVWRRSPLALHRRLPHAFAIGVPVPLPVNLENGGDFRQRGLFQEHADPTLAMPGLPMRFDLGPRQRETLCVTVTPTARGERRFEAGQLRLRSRFGLLDVDIRVGAGESRRVYPNFEQQARFAWLAGDRRIPSAGIKSVQRRGSGREFDQLLEYQAGDPIRHIDWKATAKHSRPIVRKFQDERDQDVMMLLDCGRRMRADDTQRGVGATHFDQCLNALMLLAFVALSHGDAVGAVTFGVEEKSQKRFAPRKGRQALNALMANLADVEPTAIFSDYAKVAAQCLAQRRKRSLVVMITNSRNEDAAELDAALALLHTRHVVVLANLKEEVVAQIAEQPLTTPESALECAAACDYAQARATLLRRLANRGVTTIDCEPSRLGVELVNHYRVLKRSGSI